MTELKVKKRRLNAIIPQYQHPHDAGFDLHAIRKVLLPPPIMIEDFNHVEFFPMAVPTGLQFDIPPGYEIQIRPRSSLSLHHKVTILNSPGTVDSGYEGEIRVILVNMGSKSYQIETGDRIAQAVLAPVSKAHIIPVDSIEPSSSRREGGFGSTGK